MKERSKLQWAGRFGGAVCVGSGCSVQTSYTRILIRKTRMAEKKPEDTGPHNTGDGEGA
jgi:hypothetical protein